MASDLLPSTASDSPAFSLSTDRECLQTKGRFRFVTSANDSYASARSSSITNSSNRKLWNSKALYSFETSTNV